MLIDTHAHLDMFGPGELDGVLRRAEQNGVDIIITVGTDPASCLKTLELVERYPISYGAVGFHPHEAKHITKDHLSRLKEWAKHPKVKAIGETGLDYYRDYSPRDQQRELFQAHLEVAGELGLPVIIHDREASPDTVKVLKESGLPGEKAVFHCFSGDTRLAEELLSMDCLLSVAGPVTYKNASKTVEAVKNVPLEKLLLETDCPYLTPHPYRGKQNEPAYLPVTAQKVAEIKKVAPEEVAATTTANAKLFFGL